MQDKSFVVGGMAYKGSFPRSWPGYSHMASALTEPQILDRSQPGSERCLVTSSPEMETPTTSRCTISCYVSMRPSCNCCGQPTMHILCR